MRPGNILHHLIRLSRRGHVNPPPVILEPQISVSVTVPQSFITTVLSASVQYCICIHTVHLLYCCNTEKFCNTRSGDHNKARTSLRQGGGERLEMPPRKSKTKRPC